MKRITLGSLMLFAVLAIVVGCKSGPGFAWFKREKAPEDSSAVARSAKPALPSSQSTPQAAAVAGLTPAAPPSSTNLAAASTPASGALGAAAVSSTSAPVIQPPATVPVPPSAAIAATPATSFPSDSGLADKLVSTPKSTATTSPLAGATATATAASTPTTPPMVAAGPYDPSAYKPSAAIPGDFAGSTSAAADRYAVAGSNAGATSPSFVTAAPTSLASDPADRYGSPAAITPAPVPAGPPITDPGAIAFDRYANPTIPTLPATPVTTQATAASATPIPTTVAPVTPANGVRLASAPGQYRPGGTSTYVTTSAIVPVEIASRPAPPSPPVAPPATPAPSTTPSQPWTPPAATPATGTRTY